VFDIARIANQHRRSHRRRLGSAAVAAFVWLAFPSVSLSHRLAAPASTFGAATAAASHGLPGFRLGTAGGPLGWSTAIGDFNTDGTADVAIADRVPRPMGGSSYRIEFAVSGLEPKTVAFDSEQDALTVRVSDVDRDNDLDVVVSGALSHSIVGVWLNDGHGGFAETDARPFASEARLQQSVDAADASADPSSSGLVPRRPATGLPFVVKSALSVETRPANAVQPERLQPAILSAGLTSRAPPPHSASSFS
jgi:hypothetical protein